MRDALAIIAIGFKVKRLLALIVVTLFIVLTLPVVAVFSLGMPTVNWLANTPSAEAAETMGFYMGPPMPDNTYAWGNCTWWSYAMRKWAGSPIPTNWGNANTWDDYAKRDGYVVNSTPAVGAVYQTDAGEYGHVAYVIAVNEATGEWKVSEMNAPKLNVVSTRTFRKEAAARYSFIHSKPGDDVWVPKPLSPTPPYSIGQ